MGRIICLHGIGDLAPDYWTEWEQAIRKVVGNSNAYDGAYWEDIVEGRAARTRVLSKTLAKPRRRPRREDQLRDALRILIRHNERRLAETLPSGTKAIAPRGGIWDYVGDFVKYLIDRNVRRRVQNRLRSKLLEDLTSETTLVGHSWGTVVAYDVLHQLARERSPFECLNLFTFGSPLWMEPVRDTLDDGGAREKPKNTSRWINVYNTWDSVGPSLAGGLDRLYGGSLDRDEEITFFAWNPHAILNYLSNSTVGEILQEVLRGLGLRVFLKAAHVDRKAVLIGINNYGVAAPKLNGCVNDALQIAYLLRRRYGFDNPNLRLLTDQRATQKAILERLEWLVSDARAGDQLVFHFSGHGSQVADRDGDEVDRLDEIICPYDIDWDHPISDDTFARYFDPLPRDTRLTVILDACHSGTGIRDIRPNAVDRFLVPPPDVRNRVAEAIEDLGAYLSVTIKDPEPTDPQKGPRQLFRRARKRGGYQPILIAGCKAAETSADIRVENDYHGALTYAFMKSVEAANGKISYNQLIQRIRARVKTLGTRQTPQLEGPRNRLRLRLFQ